MSSEIQKIVATNKTANATLNELNAQVCFVAYGHFLCTFFLFSINYIFCANIFVKIIFQQQQKRYFFLP